MCLCFKAPRRLLEVGRGQLGVRVPVVIVRCCLGDPEAYGPLLEFACEGQI